MPSVSVPVDAIATGPGYLLWAPLGSTLPTNTVSGSRFTDTWPVAWQLLGATDEGSEWNYSVDTDTVEVAEQLDPVAVIATGRTISMSFALAGISATNLKRLTNGGVLTTTGSGATLLTSYAPPELGEEVRCMIGWEAQDSTERLVGHQCLQTGDIAPARRKGADKALLSAEFTFEKPASGAPFGYWTAGTKRA
jgi:hypothetical protein